MWISCAQQKQLMKSITEKKSFCKREILSEMLLNQEFSQVDSKAILEKFNKNGSGTDKKD
jgi:hypothetical protein